MAMTVTKLPNVLSEAIPKKARDSSCPRIHGEILEIIPIPFTNQTPRQKEIVTAQIRTLMNLGEIQSLPHVPNLRTVVLVFALMI